MATKVEFDAEQLLTIFVITLFLLLSQGSEFHLPLPFVVTPFGLLTSLLS